MDYYLPDHQLWFQEAVNVITTETDAPPRADGVGDGRFPPINMPNFPVLSTVGGDNGTASGMDFDKQVESMILAKRKNVDPLKEWNRIRGNVTAKDLLFGSLVMSLRSQIFPLSNVLLFGPPGTGKTIRISGTEG